MILAAVITCGFFTGIAATQKDRPGKGTTDSRRNSFFKVTLVGADIFPNPVSGNRLQILLQSAKAQKINISIFDGSGNKVLTDDRDAVAGVMNYPLNIGKLGIGTYTMIISAGADQVKKQFIKN